MSKLICVYARIVGKCIHLRVTDAWYKKLQMAKAIGISLDDYAIDGVRIKRKNQKHRTSRNDMDNEFTGFDVVLNRSGKWQFKKYIPKDKLQGVISGRWGARGGIQNLPRGSV